MRAGKSVALRGEHGFIVAENVEDVICDERNQSERRTGRTCALSGIFFMGGKISGKKSARSASTLRAGLGLRRLGGRVSGSP
jgi:hypothetical protein